MTYDDLVAEYGSGPQIPDRILYDYLIDNKAKLVNMAKIEDIRERSLGKEVRRRSVFNIKWLAKYFLWDSMAVSDGGTRPIEENAFLDPQYDIFAELFLDKNPDVAPNLLSNDKTFLLLWPRGGMKSSYDHIDTVQWVLAYPDIEVLYITAEVELSTGFLGEIKGYFTLHEDDPTFINLFFPECCCLPKQMLKANRFWNPAYKAKKTGRKEPTVWASSVGKTKSGWHPRVLKFDDAVADTNSETEEQQTKISGKLFLAERLLKLGGHYKFYIGTRYGELDHYGVLEEKYMDKGDVEIKEGVGWKFYHNKTFGVKILIGRGIQIKPEVREKLEKEGRPITYINAGEEGCVLLLPKIMPFNWLMQEFSNNERVFEGQINQNPRPESYIEFRRDMMARATVLFNQMPRQGPCSQFWDFAFSKKKGRDYSTGCSIIWSEEDEYGPDGRKINRKKTIGYVRKIIRERFNHLSLAQAIVQLAREERPFIVGVEDAAGSRFLEPTIIAEAIKTGDPYLVELFSRIDWIPPDNQTDAKRVRMRALYPWIAEGRLKFLNACMAPKESTLEVLYSEFERCLQSHHHDDIPDVLSQQPRYAPRATQAIVENNVAMFSRVDQIGWDQIFEPELIPGSGVLNEDGSIAWYAPLPLVQDGFEPEPDVPSTTPHGMPNILGTGIYG